jgi:P-type conjugative transfer protein TrbJ
MKKITLLILSLLCYSTAQAGSVAGTGGASEVTQLLNYSELYSQTNTVMSSLQTQMTQLEKMRRQVMAGGPIQNFLTTKTLFSNLVSTVKRAQGIGYDAQTMAGRFSALYPDFNQKSGTNFFTQYAAMNKDLNGMLKSAMSTANLHVNNFSNDAVTAQTLEDKVATANTSESQIAAISAGNEIALTTFQQMAQMKQMQVVQNAAQTSYMAQQQQDDQATKAAAEISKPAVGQELSCHSTSTGCTAEDMKKATGYIPSSVN